jgi:hypothetical protein
MQAIPAEGATGRRLLEAAHEVGADLIVMGAFAHGEWRERAFGGVTRTMLADADLPLLMRHLRRRAKSGSNSRPAPIRHREQNEETRPRLI